MESDMATSHLREIANNTKKIAEAMTATHTIKSGSETISSHRIGALNRISKAVKYMNEIRPFIFHETKKFDKIREILLGIGGE